MQNEYNIALDRVPSKITGYLNSVILPRRSFQQGDTMPQITAERRGFKIDENHLAEFRNTCGWDSSVYAPFIYPLTLSFHYHLAILAHKGFPWSLRKLLGLRNHVAQRRRIKIGETFDLFVRTLGLRVGSKGVEFDIHTRLSSAGECVWESVHVYYLRGNFDGKDARPVRNYLPPLESSASESSWDAPSTGRLRFARLSGDFNPIHYFKPWARLLGFKRDFCHTPRIISDCIQHLPDANGISNSETARLDVVFKGPVYYGSKLVMKGVMTPGGYRFNLHSDATDKPSILGYIRKTQTDHDLLAELEN